MATEQYIIHELEDVKQLMNEAFMRKSDHVDGENIDHLKKLLKDVKKENQSLHDELQIKDQENGDLVDKLRELRRVNSDQKAQLHNLKDKLLKAEEDKLEFQNKIVSLAEAMKALLKSNNIQTERPVRDSQPQQILQ